MYHPLSKIRYKAKNDCNLFTCGQCGRFRFYGQFMSDAVSQEVNKEQKGLKNSLFVIKTVIVLLALHYANIFNPSYTMTDA